MELENIRNIAIIAHVDHGKTSLVDQLLRQSGSMDQRKVPIDRVMDSNDLERERGITILAKNTAIEWKNHHINIIDTPGHADFGGEVERILSMVDSVLLLVDAVEGPMPQTRFVTQKAFDLGLCPIVVVNKIDRAESRPDWVIDQTFDLFDRLGANDEQLDFPVIYTSAIAGYATTQADQMTDNMDVLLDLIIEKVSPPKVNREAGFQMQISSLDYNSYMGIIGIGRVQQGQMTANSSVIVVDRQGQQRSAKILQLFGFLGLERYEKDQVQAGEIIACTGIDPLHISDTLCAPDAVEALPALSVEQPTVKMMFQVNDSPFAGKEGKFVTSRKLLERLQKELLYNVALQVEETDNPDCFEVSGRGELHLSILIENMRREGYELAVSRPQVIYREVDGELCEPIEWLSLEIQTQHQGVIMETLGERSGHLVTLEPYGDDRIRLDYKIPAKSLIGFHTEFIIATSGSGIMHHVFDHYAPVKQQDFASRKQGVLVAKSTGKALAYALFNLQERGRLIVEPGDPFYEGMIIGLHRRHNDLVVNPSKAKQLTNIRASGKDDHIVLTPALKLSLEQALEFINEDELVEITPSSIRLRKKYLLEHQRKQKKTRL